MNPNREVGMEPYRLATVDLYRDNAFRLSGLPVEATPRQVRRRLAELEAAKRLGSEVSLPTGIRPVEPHPGLDLAIEALSRLRDPVRRLWDELFWLWPLPDGGLGGNSLAQALPVWLELSTASTEARYAALHNIAVVDHIAALERDRPVRGDQPDQQDLKRKPTKRWLSAHRRWRELLDEQQCRGWLLSRVEAIGDPRLRATHVDTILDRLPALLLGTHAALAVATASWDDGMARRDVEVMRGTGFEPATVDNALIEACAPHAERVREACKRVRDFTAGTADWIGSATEVLCEAKNGEDVRVLRTLLGAEHRVTAGILDDVASCVRERVVVEANKARDDGSADRLKHLRGGIECLEKSGRIAVGPHVAEQIRADTATLLSNLVVFIGDDIMAEVDGNPSSGLSQQDEMFAQTAEPLERLAELEPESAARLRDDLVFVAHNMLIVYVNDTGDAASALRPMNGLLRQTTDREARARITKTTQDLERMWRAQPYSSPPTGSASKRDPSSGSKRCIYCWNRTFSIRGFGFKRFKAGGGVESREIAAPCCGDCASRSPRWGLSQPLFGVLGPLVLALMVATNAGPDWSWERMWIPLWALGFPAVLAWLSMLRIRRFRRRMLLNRKMRQALAEGWIYSGIVT